MAPQSILDYFLYNADTHGSQTAALVKRAGYYQPVTWQEMASEAQIAAMMLLQYGIQPGDRVAIICQTRLEWVIMDMAILSAGGVTVPIYTSDLADECQYIIDNSGAVIVIAENAEQAAKFVSCRAHIPNVKKVIQLEGPLPQDASVGDWVVTYADIRQHMQVDKPRLQALQRTITQHSILTIIYTSGTTGRPKGVVITHDAMLYEAEAIAQIHLMHEKDVQLLFLPLAHAFAKVAEIAWLALRHVMAFAESMGTIKENLLDVRPTIIAGVPRIFEKFYSAVLQKGTQTKGLAGKLFAHAIVLSEKYGEAETKKTKLSLADRVLFAFLKQTIFRKIGGNLSAAMGGRMRVMISGGAPLSRKIAWFFRDANILILEGFGLTETCAATCVNRLHKNCIGTVGEPLPGTIVRIADDGELLIKGRGVMQGYWQNDAATNEAMRDGWFCTGDIASLDDKGNVMIVDRKKDIIVTAGGKNVAPQNIENLLKTDALISQVVVHGDRRNFLTALITLDADALKYFAKAQHLPDVSVEDLTQHPAVKAAVDASIKQFNKQLASYETIKKYAILPKDFSTASGELTASLKIKRKEINKRYQAMFDAFYQTSY